MSDPEKLCTAKSKRTLKRCRHGRVPGATVCKWHGGAAPQVIKSAHDRLAEMVDPLLTELFRIAQSGDGDTVRLAAIKDALDRAGYRPTEKREVTGPDGGAITFTLNLGDADPI